MATKTHYTLALKSDGKPLPEYESNYRGKCIHWGLMKEGKHTEAARMSHAHKDEAVIAVLEKELKTYKIVEIPIEIPDEK